MKLRLALSLFIAAAAGLLLSAPAAVAQKNQPLRVFIRAGEKTHGPGEHDYPRFLTECEALRRAVFAGGKTPLLFGDPEEWVALLLEALRLSALGKFAEAAQTRARAFDAAPASAGTLDGKAFAWLADCDPRFGPIFEAVINGKYYWLPCHRLQKIEFDAPVDLRDSVWMPATLTLRNGGQTVALMPTRYPGSEASADDLVRLARKTDWLEVADGSFHGVGQRMLASDEGEYPIMDVRVIEFLPLAADSGAAA